MQEDVLQRGCEAESRAVFVCNFARAHRGGEFFYQLTEGYPVVAGNLFALVECERRPHRDGRRPALDPRKPDMFRAKNVCIELETTDGMLPRGPKALEDFEIRPVKVVVQTRE